VNWQRRIIAQMSAKGLSVAFKKKIPGGRPGILMSAI
jgi:hypothetical protein